jgi:hypothetical protein
MYLSSSSRFQGNRPLLACSSLIHPGASSVDCPDFLCLLVYTFSISLVLYILLFDLRVVSIQFYNFKFCLKLKLLLSSFNISSLVLWSLHVYFAVFHINFISAAVSLALTFDCTVHVSLPYGNIGRANVAYHFIRVPFWTLARICYLLFLLSLTIL